MKTNLIEKVSKVINASGRMTKLGVSTQSEYVKEGMMIGSSNYFDIDELYKVAGKEIAKLLKVEDVVITNSASSGIAMTVASLICGENTKLIQNLHSKNIEIKKREIILPKGHSINYGVPITTMIELGGGKVIEAGCANKVTKIDVESNISENTIDLFYVKSHHCVQKNMITIEEMVELSKEYNLPLIIDAAAEEDFYKYYKLGPDFVIYSGSKALAGPASGLILCRNFENSNNIRKQFYGIGRSMKIGKENIFGLVSAVEEYLEKGINLKISLEELEEFVNKVNNINGLSAKIIQDEAGRNIFRAKIHVDSSYGLNAYELNSKLNSGNPAVYVREHELNLGNISIDPRPLNSASELDLILRLLEK